MARVRAGEIQLGWREWGKGDVTVVFIHGNLASKDWIELAAPLFPSGVRVIGIDWRGCGESGRPPPARFCQLFHAPACARHAGGA
jgi:pimeloyl-ACP methyl ester carboxylesterase